jgi:hypothetical protein
MLQIGLDGFVSPWSRWKGILAQGFVFAINGHRHTGSSSLDVDLVDQIT